MERQKTRESEREARKKDRQDKKEREREGSRPFQEVEEEYVSWKLQDMICPEPTPETLEVIAERRRTKTATPNREISCPRDNRVLFWNSSFFCRDQVQISPELSQSIERATQSKSIAFYSCNYVQYYVNPTLSAL